MYTHTYTDCRSSQLVTYQISHKAARYRDFECVHFANRHTCERKIWRSCCKNTTGFDKCYKVIHGTAGKTRPPAVRLFCRRIAHSCNKTS